MKNFNIATLATMMLVVMLGASRPLHHDLQLEHIKIMATNMSKYNDTNGVQTIPWPERNDSETCFDEDFCLAEKALKRTALNTSNLTRLLETYNKNNATKKIECHLSHDRSIHIHRFLKHLAHCAGEKAKHQKKE